MQVASVQSYDRLNPVNGQPEWAESLESWRRFHTGPTLHTRDLNPLLSGGGKRRTAIGFPTHFVLETRIVGPNEDAICIRIAVIS